MKVELQKLQELVTEIHKDNVAAGWWSDLKTDESTINTRNRAEIIALIHSELSEAWQGIGLPDDKLPQYEMFDVELADTAIRLFDVLGAHQVNLSDYTKNYDTLLGGISICLLEIHWDLSNALEGLRKQNEHKMLESLSWALFDVFSLAEDTDVDLFPIISAKREFNRTRTDHQKENRLKSDGKKI